MKNFNTLHYLLLLALGLFGSITSTNAQCGQMIWSDEFNGTAVDQSKWAFDIGNGCPNCGWGNAELQSYTNSQSNIRINNGKLELEAKWAGGSNYTSARITTKGKHSWKYGRFEMRAKIPSGTGIWPAFWMLPVNGNWPKTGEIDIMELRGDEPNKAAGTLHYGASSPNNRHDGTAYWLPQEKGTFSDDFHVFAVEWQAGQIKWYVDGNLFKTETKNPNTLDPASNDNPWPWDDQEFYLILNVAIGSKNTPYTGFQDPSFGNSALMEVDYVRVFNSPQPNIAITGPAKVFEKDLATYTVPSKANEKYTWTVPAGATITQGQNTNSIKVNWNLSKGGDVKLDVQHLTGAQCPGNTFSYTRGVQVYENNCAFVFEGFDEPSTMAVGFRHGVLAEVNNPGTNTVNGTARVGSYKRNGAEQYDILQFENGILDPAANYVGGSKVFKMDVRTDAPVGTTIELQVGNPDNSAGGYPNGVHSIYAGKTTIRNQWETITFKYSQSPDPNGATYASNLNRIIALFAPNTYTSNTFYFDNLRRDLATPVGKITLTGPASIEENQTGVQFTATGGKTNSTYEWNLPVGASITNGASTAAITASFGLSGGAVSVTERVTEGCTGEAVVVPVSVGGNSCALFADEYDNNAIGTWVKVNGQAGFFSTEAGSDWNINSTGHDQWANIDYDINNGASSVMLDFTKTGNNPVMHIRAKASAPVFVRATLVDGTGKVAGNQYLNPLNGLKLTTQYQEFTIDFNGQLWDEFSGGGVLDESKINKIRLAINPGYVTYPIAGYASSFVGDIQIDYIRIGDECATATANFVADKTTLCGTGESVTFIDQSISTDGSTTYAWNFGAGASKATANTKGPHTVSYSTSGLKTVTLNINNGASVKTRTDYIFVGTTQGGCVSKMDFIAANEKSYFTTNGNFTFAQQGTAATISTTGHDEWDNVKLDINNGTSVTPINFSCSSTKPIIKIRAKASSNCAMRVSLLDLAGVEAAGDALGTLNLFELTTTYKEFEVDLTGMFFNQFAAGGQKEVDSTQIKKVFLAINPGFATYPITGENGKYSTAFIGSVDIDVISIGEPCVITGINNTTLSSASVQFYPNPFTSKLYVSGIESFNAVDAELINAQGVVVAQGVVENGAIAIDENLPKGMYFIRLTSSTDSYVTSVMKQ